ncbi:cytochrome P450 [Pseudohyphozyma bogoriensis]|nr:cytochrome P450 [Pseudohyphozyma bogoriensis]
MSIFSQQLKGYSPIPQFKEFVSTRISSGNDIELAGAEGDMVPSSDSRRRRLLALLAYAAVALFALVGVRSTLSTVVYGFDGISGFDKMQSAMRAAPALTREHNIKEPVCVIARTYGAQIHYLPIFLLALWNAGFDDVRVFLLNTDASMSTKHLRKAANFANQLTGRADYATFLDWPITTTGDYGYALTDKALLHMYDHPELNCEYLMITNGDNVYSQSTGTLMRQGFDMKADLMGFDFISHHHWSDPVVEHEGDADKRTSVKPGTSILIDVQFKIAGIDLGAAVFKTSLLREHGLTFENTGG